MGSRRSGRPLSQGRKPTRRAQLKRILVVTEGTKTEPRYFNYLRRELRGVSIDVAPVGKTPERVVAEAIRLRDKDIAAARSEQDRANTYDQVWAVVDFDEHAYLAQSLRTAAGEGLNVAVSNPCFEVWLILHLADHRAAIGAARDAKRQWEGLRGATAVERECELLRGNLESALGRASALASARSEELRSGVGNPGTDVCDLVRAILDAAGETAATAML